MNSKNLTVSFSEEDLITIVHALGQLNRTSTFASLRNKSEELIAYINRENVVSRDNKEYRIINVENSIVLKGSLHSLKNGDIVRVKSVMDSGNFMLEQGYIIEPQFVEPIIKGIWLKAEQLWQTLAYVNQFAKDGLAIDTEKVNHILESNRPALSEK